MNQIFLHNARLALENGIERGSVLVREGRIAQMLAAGASPVGLSAAETIDLGEAYLAPGLIDIHIHGSAGVDVQDADQNDLAKLSEFLLSEGVTGYFATLVPTDERGYADAAAAINSYIENQDGGEAATGAQALGIHFEGPFVSEHRCGALRPRYFRTYDGDAGSLELFTGSNRKRPQPQAARLMTLAPEVEGGLDLARELVNSGARLFIGHSQADLETLDLALQAGAHHITHFPNALDPLHHREPGAIAWGLVRDEVTMDCIADFHHVHPLMLRLIYRSKGPGRMALISDAIMPAGMGDGDFVVWGEKIAVRKGRTALVEGAAAGAIAGSVITMRQAIANIASLGVPLHEAFLMSSLTPARAAGIERDYGSIREGKRADLVAFDERFNVKLAVVGGAVALDKR